MVSYNLVRHHFLERLAMKTNDTFQLTVTTVSDIMGVSSDHPRCREYHKRLSDDFGGYIRQSGHKNPRTGRLKMPRTAYFDSGLKAQATRYLGAGL